MNIATFLFFYISLLFVIVSLLQPQYKQFTKSVSYGSS